MSLEESRIVSKTERFDQRPNLTVLASSLIVVAVITLLTLEFPFGNDTAAHLYLTWSFIHHGFSVWDYLWYFGKIQYVGYSYTYYPIAAVFGVKAPAIVGLVAFDIFAVSSLNSKMQSRQRWLGACIIGVSLGSLIQTGAYPFLTSLASLALGFRSYFRGNTISAAFWSFVSIATSPLQLVSLGFMVAFKIFITIYEVDCPGFNRVFHRVIVGLKTFFSTPANAVLFIEIILLTGYVEIIQLYFGIGGLYPFYFSDLAMLLGGLALILIFGVVGTDSRIRFALYWLSLIYGCLAIVLFVIKSDVGGNIARIGEFAPTIAVYVWSYSKKIIVRPMAPKADVSRRRKTWIFVVLLAYSLAWLSNFVEAPLFDPSQGTLTTSSTWKGLTNYLDLHYRGLRIEYVDSLLHEGAYFLPIAGVPIARGWFRQSDFPQNEIFYKKSFSAVVYQKWLCNGQIAAVVLPPAPYDYSSTQEAKNVANSEINVLSRPVQVGVFKVYPVSGCPEMPFQIENISRNRVQVRFDRSGTFVLPLTYSRFSRARFGRIDAPVLGRLVLTVAHGGMDVIQTL